MQEISKARRFVEALAVTAWTITIGLMLLWWQSYNYRVDISGYPIKGIYGFSSNGHLVLSFEWRSSSSIRRFKIRPSEPPYPKYSFIESWALGFGAKLGNGGFAIVMPYAFLILICGAVTAIAASARPHRYSVRTLLIATTLIALLLGVAAIEAK